MKTLFNIRSLVYALSMSLFMFACSDAMEEVNPDTAAASPVAENTLVTNVVEVIPFAAIADIADCHGESIRFWGMLEQRVVTTVDGQGRTHRTRHFRPTSLNAQGWMGNLATGAATGTTYDIVAGAEMFSIHYDEGGSPTVGGSRIFIHQGTVVFVNQADGSRVVARHVIRKTPGQGLQENQWMCMGK